MARYHILMIAFFYSLNVEAIDEYTENGISYQLITNNENKDAVLPMVVAIHYMGGSAQTSKEDYAGFSRSARVVLLNGFYPIGGGFSWFPKGYYNLDSQAQDKITFAAADRLASFLDSMTVKYKTQGLPIITGYSQGADLAHIMAIRHGEKIGAILPMGARFRNSWTEGVGVDAKLPSNVILFHGMADVTVKPNNSELAFDYYKARGVAVSFEKFPGVGHAYPNGMKFRFEQIIDNLLSGQKGR
jgi:predicted esterase